MRIKIMQGGGHRKDKPTFYYSNGASYPSLIKNDRIYFRINPRSQHVEDTNNLELATHPPCYLDIDGTANALLMGNYKGRFRAFFLHKA